MTNNLESDMIARPKGFRSAQATPKLLG